MVQSQKEKERSQSRKLESAINFPPFILTYHREFYVAFGSESKFLAHARLLTLTHCILFQAGHVSAAPLGSRTTAITLLIGVSVLAVVLTWERFEMLASPRVEAVVVDRWKHNDHLHYAIAVSIFSQ